MESECALILSSVQGSFEVSDDEYDRFTEDWHYLSIKQKESNLVLDLLNVFSGLGSSFFIWSKNSENSSFDIENNPLINDVGNDMIEVCHEILRIHFDQLTLLEFVASSYTGVICESITAEFVEILEDLQECVTRFHDIHITSFLGLQKLLNYLRPSMQTLSTLASLVTEFDSKRLIDDNSNIGVLILDSLDFRCRSEAGSKKLLLQHILNSVLDSYSLLINHYINFFNFSQVDFTDFVTDFFIKTCENDEFSPSNERDYATGWNLGSFCREVGWPRVWVDERYVPKFLKNVAVSVLEIGVLLKLLDNKVQHHFLLDAKTSTITNSNDVNFRKYKFHNVEELALLIQNVHKNAMDEVYFSLKRNSQLFTILKMVFDYFLLQKSYIQDIVNNFNTSGLSDLNKRLQSYVDRDWDNSTGSFRPKLYLKCDDLYNFAGVLEYYSHFGRDLGSLEVETLDGLEKTGLEQDSSLGEWNNSFDFRGIVLCFDIELTIRLILTDKIMYRYKLMFKLLFQLKYAEYCLNQLTQYHVRAGQLAIEPELMPRFNLQLFTLNKMQYLIKNLLRFFLVDVVSEELVSFHSANYPDLLSLYNAHEKLVNKLTESMFLTNEQVLSSLLTLILIVVKFSSEVQTFNENPTFSFVTNSVYSETDSPNCSSDLMKNISRFLTTIENNSLNLNTLLRNPGYDNMVKIASTEFDKNLKLFKSHLSSSNSPLNLLI
uniref:Spindle pole body component n=1 Tax=Theileria annulata TaxID=5874 RepID=A0A3B0NBK5_THEAN